MRRRLVACSLLVCSVSLGCGSTPAFELGLVPEEPEPSWIPAAPAPAPSPWRLADRLSSRLKLDLGAGFSGAVVRGVRVVVDASGAVYATSAHELPIDAAYAVPEHLGGGFLFSGARGLWHAASFVDVPRQLDPRPVQTLSFGPSSALVVRDDGSRRLVDPASGAVKPIAPLGASVLAASSDGRVGAAWAEGGRLYGSVDDSPWVDLTGALGGATLERLVPSETSVQLQSSAGQVYELDERGLRPSPLMLPYPHLHSVHTGQVRDTALATAVTKGAPLFDDQVIYFERGTAYVLSTRSGQVVAEEPGATPPDLDCQAARFESEVMALCRGRERTVVASRPIETGPTRIEVVFDRKGVLSRVDGNALAFDGPCNGSPARAGTACLRTHGGWRDLDHSAMLGDAAGATPNRRVLDVPTKSTVLSVIAGPSGGIVDLWSGQRWPLDEEKVRAIEALLPTISAVEHRARVTGDGELELWSRSGHSVRVLDGGKRLVPSPFRFQHLVVDGPRALARDRSASGTILLQSTDWGRSFTAVNPPELPGLREAQLRGCTEVGCQLGPWLRLGWSADRDAPKPSSAPVTVAQTAARDLALPELRCSSTSPPKRKLGADSEQLRFGLGTERLPPPSDTTVSHYPLASNQPGNPGMGAEAQRAVIIGRPSGTGAARARSLRYLEPFDPAALARSASYELQAVFDAALLVGATVELDLLESNNTNFALPVLGGGLLLGDRRGSLLWVDGPSAQPIVLGSDHAELEALGAARVDAQSIAVLARRSDGHLSLLRANRGGVSTLAELPAPPDASAQASTFAVARGEGGQLYVLVAPSSKPPTAEDPALLMVPGAGLVALAPWSKLEPASSPGCAADKGVHVALSTTRAWLSTTSTFEHEQPTWLLLRWSPERVCLVAVDAPSVQVDTPRGVFDARIIARFDGRPSASMLAIGEGVELRDQRSCELVPR